MAEGMLAQASFQVEHYKISGSQSYLHIEITFISPSRVFFPIIYHFLTHLVIFL